MNNIVNNEFGFERFVNEDVVFFENDTSEFSFKISGYSANRIFVWKGGKCSNEIVKLFIKFICSFRISLIGNINHNFSLTDSGPFFNNYFDFISNHSSKYALVIFFASSYDKPLSFSASFIICSNSSSVAGRPGFAQSCAFNGFASPLISSTLFTKSRFLMKFRKASETLLFFNVMIYCVIFILFFTKILNFKNPTNDV